MSNIDDVDLLTEQLELEALQSKGELAVGSIAEPPAPKTFFAIRHGLFLATVAIPLALAVVYFFLISARTYYSEAHFIVRSSSSALGGGVGGLAAVIQNEGLSRATDETYAVDDYLVSRDIVDLLTRNDALRDMLARPEADFINRFPNFFTRDSRENLYRRYHKMVEARIEGETGISTLRVSAFRADDAHAIAVAILKYAEELINRLNERAYSDAESYAQSIVDKERARIQEIETELTTYRNAKATVDPGKEALASFEMLGKMTTELVLLQAEVQQKVALAPADPNIPAMRERIRSYQAEIDRQKLAIVGNDKSLAGKLSGYERLELERELAARSLGLAMINMTKAREDARQQHLYLQTIVEPNMADEPDRWGPWIGVGVVLLISLALFTIAKTLGAIALEHNT